MEGRGDREGWGGVGRERSRAGRQTTSRLAETVIQDHIVTKMFQIRAFWKTDLQKFILELSIIRPDCKVRAKNVSEKHS